jgi:hypothetical protein
MSTLKRIAPVFRGTAYIWVDDADQVAEAWRPDIIRFGSPMGHS